jgi:hypothetical protein
MQTQDIFAGLKLGRAPFGLALSVNFATKVKWLDIGAKRAAKVAWNLG